MKMNLKNMKNPQLKGRDSKVVRLIRNSCPFISNFGHVWSDQTRVTHLQNVLCVIRTSVVLIRDDMSDCKRHIESKQHKDFIKLKQSSRSIANYCVENQTKTNLDMQIVKAEAITCEIITDNNLSLSTANPFKIETI